MATHSGILAWKILRTEELGRPQSMASQRDRHDWATEHTRSLPAIKNTETIQPLQCSVHPFIHHPSFCGSLASRILSMKVNNTIALNNVYIYLDAEVRQSHLSNYPWTLRRERWQSSKLQELSVTEQFTPWNVHACLVAQSCPSNSETPQTVPASVLHSWDSPGKNSGVGSHSLLQGIFLTQGLNLGLLHCR